MVVDVVDVNVVERVAVSGLVALGAGFAVSKVFKFDPQAVAIGVVAGLTYLITEADVNELSLKDAVTVAVVVGFTSWIAEYIIKNWKLQDQTTSQTTSQTR